MIKFLEKFVRTKEEVAEVESKLQDYENVSDLIAINKRIFEHLTKSVEATLE